MSTVSPPEFEIVFKKLREAIAEEDIHEEPTQTFETIQAESEEIAELRRIIMETTQPQPFFFTGT